LDFAERAYDANKLGRVYTSGWNWDCRGGGVVVGVVCGPARQRAHERKLYYRFARFAACEVDIDAGTMPTNRWPSWRLD
jgi:hypothetical protein